MQVIVVNAYIQGICTQAGISSLSLCNVVVRKCIQFYSCHNNFMYMYTLFYRCKELQEQLVDMKDAVNAKKSVISSFRKLLKTRRPQLQKIN